MFFLLLLNNIDQLFMRKSILVIIYLNNKKIRFHLKIDFFYAKTILSFGLV